MPSRPALCAVVIGISRPMVRSGVSESGLFIPVLLAARSRLNVGHIHGGLAGDNQGGFVVSLHEVAADLDDRLDESLCIPGASRFRVPQGLEQQPGSPATLEAPVGEGEDRRRWGEVDPLVADDRLLVHAEWRPPKWHERRGALVQDEPADRAAGIKIGRLVCIESDGR